MIRAPASWEWDVAALGGEGPLAGLRELFSAAADEIRRVSRIGRPPTAVIVPARGGFPLAVGAARLLSDEDAGTLSEAAGTLGLPARPSASVLFLPLPFTAAHVELRVRGAVEQQVRWAVSLLRDVLSGGGPSLALYLAILGMEGRGRTADELRGLEPPGSLVYLDTVVTGRMTSLILSEMGRTGVRPDACVFAIDRWGVKLNPSVAGIYGEFGVTGVPVADAFWEDTTSALLGTGAVIYRDLVSEGLRSGGCLGGGSWHPASGERAEVFSRVASLLGRVAEGDEPDPSDLEEILRRPPREEIPGFSRRRSVWGGANVLNVDLPEREARTLIRVYRGGRRPGRPGPC